MNNNRCVDDVASALGCSRPRAVEILRAVMQALRDGLDDREAVSIEPSLPPDVRAMWPGAAGSHFGLADLGDEGFLGRVNQLAASASDDETKQMVHVVMTALMKAMAIPGDDRRRRVACAEPSAAREQNRLDEVVPRRVLSGLYNQRPLNFGVRFSRKARTPSR